MFGSIGPGELIFIFIIALLVFGPKKLPEIGRSVGKALREFKKTSDEIRGRIEEEIEASELKDIRRDIQSGVEDLRSGIDAIASGAKSIEDDIKKDIEANETGEGQKVT
jgi:TatA/E family protein of Tat protein translocase